MQLALSRICLRNLPAADNKSYIAKKAIRARLYECKVRNF